MAGTGAGDGGFLLRGVYEGSISGNHCEVERRPYHKNCGCALHNGSASINNKNKCSLHNTKVVYPIRRSWSEGNSLALFASSSSSPSTSVDHFASFSSSPSTPVDHFATKTKCPSFSHRLDVFFAQQPI